MLNDQTRFKYEKLKLYLKELGGVAVAFSGGVDSTFLLQTAHDVLEDRVIAITAMSKLFPAEEQMEASDFCASRRIRQLNVEAADLSAEAFRQNPPNRCYLCKRDIFQKIKKAAAEQHIVYVAEGSNMDDNGDYRPGMKAIAELDVKSPLRHAQLWKEEIRALSEELGLLTWDKPSLACLASRFPYGEEISEGKLAMVEKGEKFLRELGFRQVRVRIHGNLARLEVMPRDFSQLLARREDIAARLKSCGFLYVTLDLQGYRVGSMNEALKQ